MIDLVDNTLTTDLVQTRDVHEAGVVDQGVARDVHGHRCLGRKPGGDGEQVKDPLDVTNNFLRSQKFSKYLLKSQKFKTTFHQNRRSRGECG